MKRFAMWVVSGLLLFASEPGCNCGKSTLSKNGPGICAKNTACPKNEEYRKGECLTARCDNTKANPNEDCCPGQTCRFDGTCVDQIQNNCQKNVDCANGQTCQSIPAIDATQNVCSFPIPDAGGNCPPGYVVFDKLCIVDLPCTGTCPDTQVCDIELNACEALPNIPTTNSDCNVTCGVGQLKTYADPASMIFHQCCALTCQCSTLPPLSVGQFGRDANAALAANEIVVSSYDVTYGDLVLSHHKLTDGTMTSIEDVDGAPATGTLAGDPKGFRRGISDPGVDVGTYSSVVIGPDGNPRIAYYDHTNADLKYAEKTSAGWQIHTVDSPGDVGSYTSMVVQTGGGKLRIAYLMVSGPKLGQSQGDTTAYTGLRYAESTTDSPRSSADWKLVDVDTEPVLGLPCGGTCASTQICVEVSAGPPEQDLCAVASTLCTGVPSANQVCATPVGQTTPGYYVPRTVPQVVEFPPALGLFSSMADSGSQVLISYYDNWNFKDPPNDTQTGQLKGASLTLNGSGSAVNSSPALFVLDQGDPCDYPTEATHDVGRFTSIALSETGAIGIAYFDAYAKELRFWTASTFGNPTGASLGDGKNCILDGQTSSSAPWKYITIADNDGIDFVGANPSLLFSSSGEAHIAYQASRNIVLKLAQGTNGSGFTNAVVSTGALPSVGFFAKLLSNGSQNWVMNVHIGFDANNNPNDAILVQPITFQ